MGHHLISVVTFSFLKIVDIPIIVVLLFSHHVAHGESDQWLAALGKERFYALVYDAVFHVAVVVVIDRWVMAFCLDLAVEPSQFAKKIGRIVVVKL